MFDKGVMCAKAILQETGKALRYHESKFCKSLTSLIFIFTSFCDL